MASLVVYPETESFRQVVAYVTRHMGYTASVRSKQLPTLKFIGTVKLHGSNTAIAYQKDIGYWFQSRRRVLTEDADNCSFFQHMNPLAEKFFTDHVIVHCPMIREYYTKGCTIVIYGEWCGGNIQGHANVAITGLTQMFVIFKIRVVEQTGMMKNRDNYGQSKYKENNDEFWIDSAQWVDVKWHEHFIYNIYNFRTYEIDINFQTPELSQNTLTQLTEDVERQCPVGAYFARIGCGEGIVWTEWQQTHGNLTFKVKGKQHSIINTNTLVPVYTLKIESVEDFVGYACTNNRMVQAFESIHEELRRVGAKDFDTFVRWLAEDIIKEEKDTIDEAHIDARDVRRVIMSTAQTWFDDHLTEIRKHKKRSK